MQLSDDPRLCLPPSDESRMNLGGLAAAAQVLPKCRIDKHLRDLGEKEQVGLRGVPGYQKTKHVAYGLAVWSIEGNRASQANECGDRAGEPSDTRVRDCDSATKSRRSDFFALDKARLHLRGGESVERADKSSDLLERAMLGRNLDIEKDVSRGQYRGNGVP